MSIPNTETKNGQFSGPLSTLLQAAEDDGISIALAGDSLQVGGDNADLWQEKLFARGDEIKEHLQQQQSPNLLGERRGCLCRMSIGTMSQRYPSLRPPVIEGLLRRGETLNIIGAAKAGKSYLAHGLAWAVADGREWLGHEVVQGRVLILDNELHPETLTHRLCRIANEMMISIDDAANLIDVVPMRGLGVTIGELRARVEDITPAEYALVVLDALYRTLPPGTSENDNAAMMAIYNRLDEYAREWDAAVAVIHHASKGAQGDKSVTDVGAGAGAISRAADSHLIIRPHEEPELAVMECVCRSWMSPPPRSIRYKWPLWGVDHATEPVVRQARSAASKRQEAANKAADDEVMALFVGGKRLATSSVVNRVSFGRERAKTTLARLVGQNLLIRRFKRSKSNGRKTAVYTVNSGTK